MGDDADPRAQSTSLSEAEELVLDQLRRTERISRSEAAALLGLEPVEASRLLRAMVDKGRLEMRGAKRGAHYVVAE